MILCVQVDKSSVLMISVRFYSDLLVQSINAYEAAQIIQRLVEIHTKKSYFNTL